MMATEEEGEGEGGPEVWKFRVLEYNEIAVAAKLFAGNKQKKNGGKTCP
jgi:hypothetical protein